MLINDSNLEKASKPSERTTHLDVDTKLCDNGGELTNNADILTCEGIPAPESGSFSDRPGRIRVWKSAENDEADIESSISLEMKFETSRRLPELTKDSEKRKRGLAVIDGGLPIPVPETHTGAITSSAEITSQSDVAKASPGRSNVSK
jgi:hypothetical protein